MSGSVRFIIALVVGLVRWVEALLSSSMCAGSRSFRESTVLVLAGTDAQLEHFDSLGVIPW